MSLHKEKTTLAIMLCKCGAHPTLVALYLKADPRSILKKLTEHDIFGPWPRVPLDPPSSTLRTHARAILQNPRLLLAPETIELLKEGEPSLNPDKYNLLLRTLIDERQQLALKAS